MKKLTGTFFAWAVLSSISGSQVAAATIQLKPVADTMINEFSPDNNYGAHVHFASGGILRLRPDDKANRTRAFLKFDLSSIPPGSLIQSVSLQLTVTFKPFGGQSSTYELRRVLKPWQEGAKAGSSGAPASANEVTWNAAAANSLNWTSPGASAPEDTVQTGSASLAIDGAATYTFPSTALLIADVQKFIDDPSTNFGWMLIALAEDTPQTTRRFGAREDSVNAPKLVVDYTAGTPPLRITSITATGQNVTLVWTGGQPPFQIEKSTSLIPANWLRVGPVTSNRTETLSSADPQAFFRIAQTSP